MVHLKGLFAKTVIVSAMAALPVVGAPIARIDKKLGSGDLADAFRAKIEEKAQKKLEIQEATHDAEKTAILDDLALHLARKTLHRRGAEGVAAFLNQKCPIDETRFTAKDIINHLIKNRKTLFKQNPGMFTDAMQSNIKLHIEHGLLDDAETILLGWQETQPIDPSNDHAPTMS